MVDNTEIFDLLSKMYSEMQVMKENIKNVETKINKEFNDINVKIDNLSAHIGKMITNEVAQELSEHLKTIKTEVKFVKYKVQENEEDLFRIQSYLKISK